MPFFYLQSARERLCLQKRIPAHICFSLDQIRHTDPESLRIERSEAIIYSLVIVVFYAAIILIVVGTNMHRCRKRRQRLCRQQVAGRPVRSPQLIVSIEKEPDKPTLALSKGQSDLIETIGSPV